MRVNSAARAKNSRRGQHTHLVPTDGSHLRELYDLFKAHPATPVYLPGTHANNGHGQLLEQLRNFYGLDIRPLGEAHQPTGRRGGHRKRYWLVGEWFGATYLDYVADRRAREERELYRSISDDT